MNYSGLALYIENLCKQYHFDIVIKDFSGLFEVDLLLFKALQKFYIHDNPYCLHIKENARLWRYCLATKRLVFERLVANPTPFIGTCYAGITELVVPIIANNIVIGSFHVGPLATKQPELYFNKIAKHSDRTLNNLSTTFPKQPSTPPNLDAFSGLIDDLQIVSEYLQLLHRKTANSNYSSSPSGITNNQPYIMGHALAYIHQHYCENLRLSSIASFCHCSTSYLSHQFKTYTGSTLKTHINLLRIKQAKKRLTTSTVPISTLAFELGFTDSNYFSKVFKDITGISPTTYRKSY